MGVGEGFADEGFIAGGGGEQAAGAEERAVERGVAAFGEGVDEAGGGLGHAGDVERDLHGHGRLDGGDAGEGGDLRGDGGGGAFEGREDVGEAVALVVAVACGFEGEDQAARHDHHGEPAGHDEGDGEGLGLEGAQVAEEFEIEEAHGAGGGSRLPVELADGAAG